MPATQLMRLKLQECDLGPASPYISHLYYSESVSGPRCTFCITYGSHHQGSHVEFAAYTISDVDIWVVLKAMYTLGQGHHYIESDATWWTSCTEGCNLDKCTIFCTGGGHGTRVTRATRKRDHPTTSAKKCYTLVNVLHLVRRTLELWAMSVGTPAVHDQADKHWNLLFLPESAYHSPLKHAKPTNTTLA